MMGKAHAPHVPSAHPMPLCPQVFPPVRAKLSSLLCPKTAQGASRPGHSLVMSGRALPTAKPSRTSVYSQLLMTTLRQAFQLGQGGCAARPRSAGAVGWGAVTVRPGPAFPGQPCPGCPTRRLPQPLGRALAALPAVCTGSRMIGEAGGKG